MLLAGEPAVAVCHEGVGDVRVESGDSVDIVAALSSEVLHAGRWYLTRVEVVQTRLTRGMGLATLISGRWCAYWNRSGR